MTEEKTPNAPPNGRSRKRPRAWLALTLVGVVTLIIGGLFVWQRIEQPAAAAAPERAAALFAEAGVDFSYAMVDVTGAPARVNIDIAAPRLDATALGWSWTSESLTIDRLVYRLRRASLVAEGPHYLTTELGEIRLDGRLRGDATVRDDMLERAALRGVDMTVDVDGPEGAPPRPMREIDLVVCAPTVAEPGACGEGAPTVDAAAGFPLLVFFHIEFLTLRDGSRVSTRVAGVAYFEGPLRLDAPPPALIRLDIEDATVRLLPGDDDADYDYADLTAAGVVEIREARLAGRLAVASDAAPELLDMLETSGALSTASAGALRPRIAPSGRLAGALEIDGGAWRMLDLQPEPIAVTAP